MLRACLSPIIAVVVAGAITACGQPGDSTTTTATVRSADTAAVRVVFLEFVERFLSEDPARACELVVGERRDDLARELSDGETDDCAVAVAGALRGSSFDDRRVALERAGEAVKDIEVEGNVAFVGRGTNDEARLVRSAGRWLIEKP